EWQIVGKTVRGASHLRNSLPNQDYIDWLPNSGHGLTSGSRVILAISDGHGSPKYFRSDRGAKLAVQTALKEMEQFLREPGDPSTIKRLLDEQLPKKLVHSWRERVNSDLAENPIVTKQWNELAERESPAAVTIVQANQVLAYGATLLLVLVTEDYISYLQLGDGDILTISEKRTVSRPLPSDSRLIANETTSLCSHDAWKDFRVHFQALPGSSPPPALIMLSTDGYSNSFRDPDGF